MIEVLKGHAFHACMKKHDLLTLQSLFKGRGQSYDLHNKNGSTHRCCWLLVLPRYSTLTLQECFFVL